MSTSSSCLPDDRARSTMPRRARRLAWGALAAAVAVVPLLSPAPAQAGQVGVTLGITGSGRVEIVEGSIEDGGSLACDRTSNLDHRVTMTCPRIRNEEAFEAWVWLRPSLFGAPADWEFSTWQGCDTTRTVNGMQECGVHSDAFNSVERFPVAVFRDAVAPEITRFNAAQIPGEQGAFRFTWSASGASGSQCKVDSGAWQQCTSPRVLTLPSGPHLFAVRAEDTSGNLSFSHSLQVHSVDTAFTSTPPRLAATRTAGFTFSAAGGDAFDCVLDGNPFTCDSGSAQFTDLAEGVHYFTAAARQDTWTDPVPVRWDWTVDTTAPDTALTGGPAEGSSTTSTTASFMLDAPGAVDFSCTIDGAGTPCDRGPVVLAGLAPGPHVFEASARDEAGNSDPSPARRAWTVTTPPVIDRTAPDTTVVGGPVDGAVATSTSARFEIGTTEAGSSVRCTLDAVAVPCAPGALSLTDLGAGTHNFTVVATDGAGNTDPSAATRTWTVPVAASALKAKGWKSKPVTGAFAGRTLVTKRKGARASYSVIAARQLALVVGRGPKDGKVKVYAGKRLLRTISLKGATSTAQVITVTAFDAPYTGTVRIVVASRGKPVRVEGLAAPTR